MIVPLSWKHYETQVPDVTYHGAYHPPDLRLLIT